MRSSIACTWCRRSKVKCVNSGVGTSCRACDNAQRECIYPSPVPSGGRRADGITGKLDAPLDGERRQKSRKSTHPSTANNPPSASHDSPRPLLDALDPRLLTPTVWQELFDIFQVHYSADLPFLHPPTFLRPLRQASMQPPPSLSRSTEASIPTRPPASPEFLLAFLALTARFHTKLVAHHSPPMSDRPSNPLIASEYYAAAATEKVVTSWTDNTIHDIERIQATLMLGLHEWGMCRGPKAWLTIGMAIRAAQAMGLQYEHDLDDQPLSRSQALDGEARMMGVDPRRRSSSSSTQTREEAFVQQEIRRRTFWSCYIMDRCLSSGKYRPQTLRAQDLRIQLPASERSFLFAEKVRTLMLGEEGRMVVARTEDRQAWAALGPNGFCKSDLASPSNVQSTEDCDEDKGRLETGADEGLLSRYIKILEIYGEVVKWSCAGGRRTESLPPWDPKCRWYMLRKQCLDFKARLPRQQTLTPQNTQAHISLKTSTPYTLVHTVYLLCQNMLHREYVPFIPLRCTKPEGPLDPPICAPSKDDPPPGFWEDSARECFRAAREIMDLVRSCQEWSALVETPIVGFAIYTVAFVGVYCINFPWMDPDGCMSAPPPRAHSDTQPTRDGHGVDAARRAVQIIGQMRPRLHMANGWFKTITRMHRYFKRMKSDYYKNIQSMDRPESDAGSVSARHLSLREGGIGGGLEEFKLFERALKDFGSLEEQDAEMTDAGPPSGSRSSADLDDGSSVDSTTKSEDQDQKTAPAEQTRVEDRGLWNAINAGPGRPASQRASLSAPSGQFRSFDSYPPAQPPSLPPLQHQTPDYQLQIHNFRPAHILDTPSTAGAPPSLTSPASLTASSSSQAQPPSPFDRRPSQPYSPWAPQPASSGYPMPPPQPLYAAATNGIPQTTPAPPNPATAAAAEHAGDNPLLQPSPQLARQPQAWDHKRKEAWLDGLPLGIPSDDLMAFITGVEPEDYAAGLSEGGWFSTLHWDGSAAAAAAASH